MILLHVAIACLLSFNLKKSLQKNDDKINVTKATHTIKFCFYCYYYIADYIAAS